MKTVRHLHLVGATGEIRTAEYDGREHLVVPVVAMVEGVVWAVNSEVPEFVPAEELAQTPQQWNGRNAFAGHPKDGGTQVTANTPKILEESFGVIFNTVSAERILKTRRLEFEVWMDAGRAAILGAAQYSVVTRLRAGKRVEVSVGCYVEAEDVDGKFDGKEYHGVWRNIVSDHIAFLAEGEKGACSIAAGCGASRAATRHLVTAEGLQEVKTLPNIPSKPSSTPTQTPASPPVSTPTKSTPNVPGPTKRGLKERFAALIPFMSELRTDASLTDRDVRQAIDDALRAVEPGYMGIDCVYPDDKIVIYYVAPEDVWKLMRRSYTMTEGGVATLTDDATEVEPVVTYEPVAAAAAHTPCSCGGQQVHPEHQPQPTVAEGANMDRKALITKLIASKHNPFKDQKGLEASSDEALTLLETHIGNAEALETAEADRVAKEKKEKEVVTPLAPAAAAASVTPPTEEEWLKTAPQSIRDMHARQTAADTAKRTELVTALKTAQTVYSEKELMAMSLNVLERTAQLAQVEVTSYVGRGVPRAAADGADVFANPPSPYNDDALKAFREARSH